MKLSLICIALLATSAFAFYGEDSSVVMLTEHTFESEVIDSDTYWLIEFFAPWCGHCKKLTPEWERAAKGLKGIVSMGAVDMTTDGSVGTPYDVQGYPTLKWFGDDKSAPEDFEGGRTAGGIINFATRKLKEIANGRIGNKKRAKAEKKEEPKKEEEPQQQEETGDDEVVVLTEDNFEELVEQSNEPWFIEFYAPWCGHCKNLTPIWKKLASAVKGTVNVAKIDTTDNKSLGERFEVKGYPTIKFFPGGEKSDSSAVTYDGGRDLDALEQYANEQAALSLPAKFKQLTSEQDYEDYCVNVRGACLIVFIPSLVDSSLGQRNNYISQIQQVADATRGKPFTFLWSEGGQQYEFENTYGVGGSGYPAVLAIANKKSKYVTLRASFTGQNLQSFVDNIGAGKQPFSSFANRPAIKEVSQWVAEEAVRNEDL